MNKINGNRKKILSLLMIAVLGLTLPAGCSSDMEEDISSSAASGELESGETELIFGDTTFNAENEELDVNPHNAYSGWACIRYGIGETLFKYSDEMEIEPWLASGYEQTDDLTWVITLRGDVTFSNGREMDADAVKDCLDHLIEVHEQAAGDLKIESIEADGLTLTITTSEANPTLLNSLCYPYSCIIDMNEGITEDGLVVGTGPYTAVSIEPDEELDLVKNENYWDGEPGYDRITVLTITDGDTLTMALQSGEIDAAYGLPYSSYSLFDNDDYNISGTATSRAFFAHMNFDSEIIQDDAVRAAIAMGIDKDGFVENLLDGYGYAAEGAFPDSFSYGGDAVDAKEYDPDAAAKLLEEAGWIDTDGDGIREKDGETLTIRWLTYPSRQELPLLAEYAQAQLLEIGIEVEINSTADHNSVLQDPDAWDVYASAMVTAPSGDAEYFFTTHCLDDSTANNGNYHSDELEALEDELAVTFGAEERAALAVEMQQVLLDDDAFVFFSHLQMNIVSSADVKGLTAHTCDFYEITVDLAPAE